MPEYFKFNHDPAYPYRLFGIPFTEMVKFEQGQLYFLDKTNSHSMLNIPNEYYIGAYPVTQSLFKYIVEYNPSRYEGDFRPVDSISWNELIEENGFFSKINLLHSNKTTENRWIFNLPYHYQWLYAANKNNLGVYTEFSGGKEINDLGWCNTNALTTMPVGLKSPNKSGIFDLCGNVHELCLDDFHLGKDLIIEKYNFPLGLSNLTKLMKGGSFKSSPVSCHLMANSLMEANKTNDDIGFRLCLVNID